MKHDDTACKQGFGLVELMVTMLATSIVALTVGSILYYTWVGWKRNNDSVNMQRDASLAMRVIAREIRRTPIENISGGSTLTCGTGNSFAPNGRDLVHNGFILIDGWLTGFSSTVNSNNASVQVSLNLSTGFDHSAVQATFYSRN